MIWHRLTRLRTTSHPHFFMSLAAERHPDDLSRDDHTDVVVRVFLAELLCSSACLFHCHSLRKLELCPITRASWAHRGLGVSMFNCVASSRSHDLIISQWVRVLHFTETRPKNTEHVFAIGRRRGNATRQANVYSHSLQSCLRARPWARSQRASTSVAHERDRSSS